MSHTGEVSFASVTHKVFVAPSGIFCLSAHAISAVGVVPHGVQGLASRSVKHGEQLFALEYSSTIGAVVGIVVDGEYFVVGGCEAYVAF